ncbi:PelD GGDEF domain-containing protein [Succinivibrio dextrinosolvens]|uniref:PelD GGDEF domain-containing protein n=1 Tax=Succinivibrio dextrinosolvens TaxID=83771 RepID=UPI0008F43417|nr:PelD GGDEF domain-containing protein [Succinivibrio dextrinosolvens]SFS44592.1 PelD GGDEF domain-containing protein [Succinivibrio dextrinosolvens]
MKKSLKALGRLITSGSGLPLIVWVETVVLAAISSIIWMNSIEIYFDQSGPVPVFTVENTSEFFWPLVFVVIVALRYGFSMGFISAILSIVLTLSFFKYHGITDYFSYYQAVGMLVVNMIAGEFRDVWEERLHRNDLDYAFMKKKLSLFTQNYFMLRSSHDQLEQRMAGQVVSLRSSISELEKLNERYPVLGVKQYDRITSLAPHVLKLLASIVVMEEAGIYRIEKGRIDPKPLSAIGKMAELDLKDSMLNDMMESRELLSPINLYETDSALKYQLCIPLIDTAGVMHACVVVSQVKFFTLTSQNIAILNLVSAYAADMMSTGVIAPVIQSSEKDLFLSYLKKALDENKYHGQNSSIVFCRGYTDAALELFDKTISLRRGADIYWKRKNNANENILVVLLPLTSKLQAQLYIDRVDRLMTKESDGAIKLDFTGPLDVAVDNDQLISELKKLDLKDDDFSYCFKPD